MAGLEPADEGVKVPCLTTWLHPYVEKQMRDRDLLPIPHLFVGWVKGLEPSTPGTTIRCSNQLSYTHHISCTREPATYSKKSGTPEGTRTPGPLLRRQLLYPTELLAHRKKLERVTGIEPASPAWKAGALAIVLHPRLPPEEIVSLVIIPFWKNFVNINSEKTAIFFTESRRSHPGSPAPDPDPPAAGHRA